MKEKTIAERIARDILATEGGPPVEHPMLNKFVREYNSRKWEYGALFQGRKKVGKRPASEHKGFMRSFGDQIQNIASEIIGIQIKPDILAISFIGTKGRSDTYAFTPEPFSQSVPGARPVKKKRYVSDIAEEVKQKLIDMGMQSLGMRHAKAGEQFADRADDARRIAVGKRDLLLNSFQVVIGRDDQLKRPQTSWVMADSVLLSKVDDRILERAVKWAKKSVSMKEIRERARQKYLAKKSQGDPNSVAVVLG